MHQISSSSRENAKPRRPIRHLSARELEVLKLIADGASSAEIAEALCITARTVNFHRGNLAAKLGTNKAALLAKCAIRLKISDL